eukprot:2795138-Prymnesium_polylepis.1
MPKVTMLSIKTYAGEESCSHKPIHWVEKEVRRCEHFTVTVSRRPRGVDPKHSSAIGLGRRPKTQ